MSSCIMTNEFGEILSPTERRPLIVSADDVFFQQHITHPEIPLFDSCWLSSELPYGDGISCYVVEYPEEIDQDGQPVLNESNLPKVREISLTPDYTVYVDAKPQKYLFDIFWELQETGDGTKDNPYINVCSVFGTQDGIVSNGSKEGFYLEELCMMFSDMCRPPVICVRIKGIINVPLCTRFTIPCKNYPILYFDFSEAVFQYDTEAHSVFWPPGTYDHSLFDFRCDARVIVNGLNLDLQFINTLHDPQYYVTNRLNIRFPDNYDHPRGIFCNLINSHIYGGYRRPSSDYIYDRPPEMFIEKATVCNCNFDSVLISMVGDFVSSSVISCNYCRLVFIGDSDIHTHYTAANVVNSCFLAEHPQIADISTDTVPSISCNNIFSSSVYFPAGNVSFNVVAKSTNVVCLIFWITGHGAYLTVLAEQVLTGGIDVDSIETLVTDSILNIVYDNALSSDSLSLSYGGNVGMLVGYGANIKSCEISVDLTISEIFASLWDHVYIAGIEVYEAYDEEDKYNSFKQNNKISVSIKGFTCENLIIEQGRSGNVFLHRGDIVYDRLPTFGYQRTTCTIS